MYLFATKRFPLLLSGRLRVGTGILTIAVTYVTVALRELRSLRPGEPSTFDMITQDQILSIVGKFTTYFFVAMVALSSVALAHARPARIRAVPVRG